MEQIKLKPCPICGKQPKIIRDYGYEASGFGAWCRLYRGWNEQESLNASKHINQYK